MRDNTGECLDTGGGSTHNQVFRLEVRVPPSISERYKNNPPKWVVFDIVEHMAIEIRENVPLKKFTTLNVGGPTRYYTIVHSVSDVKEAYDWTVKNNQRILYLGGGSNMLIGDRGFDGLVLHNKIQGKEYREEDDTIYIEVGAGEDWDQFVLETVEKGLYGLENLSGIPGTVGAAPVQNINAYGSSVQDTIVWVKAYHVLSGTLHTFTSEECRFSYRDSFFKTPEGKSYFITSVCFVLSKVKSIQTAYKSALQSIEKFLYNEHITDPTSADIRQAVLSIRKKIGMLQGIYNSAGSFFKNTILSLHEFERVKAIVEQRHAQKSQELSPWYWLMPDGNVKVSTAFLLECTEYNKTSFAGKSFRGTVGISPVHTLSLINLGNATSDDIAAFAHCITKAVQKEFTISIECEVEFVGIE